MRNVLLVSALCAGFCSSAPAPLPKVWRAADVVGTWEFCGSPGASVSYRVFLHPDGGTFSMHMSENPYHYSGIWRLDDGGLKMEEKSLSNGYGWSGTYKLTSRDGRLTAVLNGYTMTKVSHRTD